MTAIESHVTEFMSSPVYTVPVSESLATAQRRIEELNISSISVVDEKEELGGVITRTDLLRLGRERARDVRRPTLIALPDRPVGEVMTKPAIEIAPEATIQQAAARILEHKIHRLYVVNQAKKLVGVLSTKDVMRAVFKARVNVPLAKLMSTPVYTVEASERAWVATDMLEKKQVSGVTVIEDGGPVGFFTKSEALAARDLSALTPVGDVMNCSIVCLPASTHLFRAAAIIVETYARRVLATEEGRVAGILTGTDFVRAAAMGGQAA
ncbi:MAG TPA: CBS domain-containing protein [Planctomycetota bacterium]|nr:CBS domain-containing protein [Planctomycetota bacterium]